MTQNVSDQSLNEIFKSPAISQIQNELKKSQIIEVFNDFIDIASFKLWHLSLYKFATIRPLLFFRHETIDDAIELFNTRPELTVEAITSLQRELTHAIFSLLRPGSSWQKEDSLSLERPEQIAEFDSIWHPEYQRYSEHVFNHLIQVPLYILGKKKDKNYLEPSLANRVDILRSNGLFSLIRGYDSVVRNAISHGSISFELHQIVYADKSKTSSFMASEFASLFDDLVDTCHSLVVGLLLFLSDNQFLIERTGLQNLPLGLRFIFVDAFTSHSGLQVLSMVEHKIIGNKDQLDITCKINSKAKWVHRFEGFHICWWASKFGGRGYDRFHISFDCGMPVTSSLIFNGVRLSQAILTNEPFETCGPPIIEHDLLWYNGSIFDQKSYIWKNIFSIQWSRLKKQLIQDWRDRGLKIFPQYLVCRIENTSPSRFTRLEAHIVLREKGVITDAFLVYIVKHIIRRLGKYKIRKKDIQGEIGRPTKPKYIIARVYAANKRFRTLKLSGWKNEELVLIAEWSSSKKHAYQYYTKQADVITGKMRIKYNPNILKSSPPSI